ncbi:MAG: hypothetical protein K8I60_17185, partial [Anaerolineae bacterium]|nr:hypothetical protein [Anaerolineae bacterium]
MNRRVLFILLGIFAVLIVFTILQNQSIKRQIAESTPIVSFLRVYPDMAVLDIQAVRMSVRG